MIESGQDKPSVSEMLDILAIPLDDLLESECRVREDCTEHTMSDGTEPDVEAMRGRASALDNAYKDYFQNVSATIANYGIGNALITKALEVCPEFSWSLEGLTLALLSLSDARGTVDLDTQTLYEAIRGDLNFDPDSSAPTADTQEAALQRSVYEQLPSVYKDTFCSYYERASVNNLSKLTINAVVEESLENWHSACDADIEYLGGKAAIRACDASSERLALSVQMLRRYEPLSSRRGEEDSTYIEHMQHARVNPDLPQPAEDAPDIPRSRANSDASQISDASFESEEERPERPREGMTGEQVAACFVSRLKAASCASQYVPGWGKI